MQELTITIDLAKAKDARAANMVGKKDDVFLWAWGGYTAERGSQPLKGPGQSSFNAATGTKFTNIGGDKWQVKLNPSVFFSATQSVKWFGILAKNMSGAAQTEDFIVELYEPYDLKIGFINPATKSIYALPGDTLSFSVRSNPVMNITVENKDLGTLAQNPATDSLELKVAIPKTNTASLYNVVAMGTKDGKKTSDSIQINIPPTVVIEEPKFGVPIKNGVNYLKNGRVVFQILAPKKKFIHLIGEFNNWQIDNAYLMKKWGESFWLEVSGLDANTEYAYQYQIDGGLKVADPFAEKILDPNNDAQISASVFPNMRSYPSSGAKGIVSTFKINKEAFTWSVTNFKRPADTQLVIYELLVRDFTTEGSFQGVIDKMDYLKNLGVNCLELMPIMEFTNNDSWGYNPIFYTAVDKAYGPAHKLKELIDLCHKNGIAVILDMVLNQADAENPYVKMYWDGTKPSADSPFFNPTATHPFSVFYDFNHESPYTKAITKEISDFWLTEFKFDGFRFDLSKGFTQKNSGTDVAKWGQYDLSRVAIWKEYYDHIRKTDPTAYVILEHFADANEERDLTNYGMLTWANENGAFKNVTSGFTASLRGIDYKNRGLDRPRGILYMESHDEERLAFNASSKGLSAGNYSAKTLSTFTKRHAAAAALWLMAPGPKMLWQFGELAYDVSIETNGRTGRKPVRWDYLNDANRNLLYKTYGQLIKLKLSSGMFLEASHQITEDGNLKTSVLEHPLGKVFTVANLGLEDYTGAIQYPQAGLYKDFMTGEDVMIESEKTFQKLQAGEWHIYSTIPTMVATEKGLASYPAFVSGAVLGFEELESKKLSVYPNPASEKIVIQYKKAKAVGLEIYTATGQQMYKASQVLSNGIDLDVHNWPAGPYYIIIRDGKTYSSKFIKVD